jgi:apolipoprotein D and lipocalin family protein
MIKTRLLALVSLAVLATGCTGLPAGVEPVKGFELDRYLGTWYEIARLDHPFERGLENITATYELRGDGGVRVLNRGFDVSAGTWREAEGKAYFIGSPDVGRLKVSFFGPFYGSYNIMALDQEGYRWAMISGPDTDYLWILSRDPVLPEGVLDRLLALAADRGFDTGKLIYVQHQPPQP